ncbi:MAG TPA: hypothetical protein VFX98_19825 [Longimicrobiaceae bacterium]|nr:hypothetical protein [Longimicrobiaceae bacterium]
MSEMVYVWAAYGLTWGVLTAYALYVRRRMHRARMALEEVLG